MPSPMANVHARYPALPGTARLLSPLGTQVVYFRSSTIGCYF